VATPTLKAALVGVNIGVQAQSAYTETAIFLSPGQNRTVSQAVGDFGVRVCAVARPVGNIEIRGFESACPANQLLPNLWFVSTNALSYCSWIDCTYHTLVLDSQWVKKLLAYEKEVNEGFAKTGNGSLNFPSI